MGKVVNPPVELRGPSELERLEDEIAEHLGSLLLSLVEAQRVAQVCQVFRGLELGNARRKHLSNRENRGE